MSAFIVGRSSWGLRQDRGGDKDYTLITKVRTDDPRDGPYTVSGAAGLPQVGDPWMFGNDEDIWAWCTAECTVTEMVTDEPGYWWKVEQVFSTKPTDPPKCGGEVKNPLCEPSKVSGRFTKSKKEASTDRHGDPVLSSAREQLRGSQMEFDDSTSTVKIVQNVSDLQKNLLYGLIDEVNNAPMWGFPERTVKLSMASWDKKYYGPFLRFGTGTGTGTADCPDYTGCLVYFERTLEFDIDLETFDRDVLDEGSRCLKGYWDTDRSSPTFGAFVYTGTALLTGPPSAHKESDFIRYIDPAGNVARVVLDGTGLPANATVLVPGVGTLTSGSPGKIHVEKYFGANFFLLSGIPVSIDT